MKNKRYLLLIFLLGIIFSCQNNTKKEAEKDIEVRIEKTEQGSKALITIKKTEDGKVIEEKQTIEGAHEDVMKKVKMLTEDFHPANAEVNQTIKRIEFKLNPKSGTNTQGKISFTEENGKVTLNASITGLEEGIHAIHIHEKADCSSADGKSTGGHWNPTFQPHGAWGSTAGYHRGDIGNFEADAEGKGTISFSSDQWCLDCDDPTKNITGKAIIVHQGADDLKSQPSGAAGSRISCAGIIQ